MRGMVAGNEHILIWIVGRSLRGMAAIKGHQLIKGDVRNRESFEKNGRWMVKINVHLLKIIVQGKWHSIKRVV